MDSVLSPGLGCVYGWRGGHLLIIKNFSNYILQSHRFWLSECSVAGFWGKGYLLIAVYSCWLPFTSLHSYQLVSHSMGFKTVWGQSLLWVDNLKRDLEVFSWIVRGEALRPCSCDLSPHCVLYRAALSHMQWQRPVSLVAEPAPHCVMAAGLWSPGIPKHGWPLPASPILLISCLLRTGPVWTTHTGRPLTRSPRNSPNSFLLAVFITDSQSIAYFKWKQMMLSRLSDTRVFAF